MQPQRRTSHTEDRAAPSSEILSRRYLDALRAADRARALAAVEEGLSAGLAPADIYVEVIAPAMHKIGELWAEGALTPADEHLATAITERVLAELYPRGLGPTPNELPTVLLAAPEGERHVLGLRMATDLLDAHGHRTRYLGADVPNGALLNAVEEHQPLVVCLGVSLTSNVPALLDVLRELAARRVAVLLGGRVPAVLRDAGVPWIGDLRDLPEALARATQTLDWQRSIAAVELPVRRDSTRRAPPPPTGAAADLAATAADAGQLARAAMLRSHRDATLSEYDRLTGLPGYGALQDRLRPAGEREAALALIDIDDFHGLNETRGRQEADRILASLAMAIAVALPEGAYLARVGGDLFAALVPKHTSDGPGAAERVRAEIAARSDLPAVSIGVASASPDARTAFAAATRALASAKAAGGDRVSVAAAECPGESR